MFFFLHAPVDSQDTCYLDRTIFRFMNDSCFESVCWKGMGGHNKMTIKQSTLPETNMVPGKQIAVDCSSTLAPKKAATVALKNMVHYVFQVCESPILSSYTGNFLPSFPKITPNAVFWGWLWTPTLVTCKRCRGVWSCQQITSWTRQDCCLIHRDVNPVVIDAFDRWFYQLI